MTGPPAATVGQRVWQGTWSVPTYMGDPMDSRLALGGAPVLRVQAVARERRAPGAAMRVRLRREGCRAMTESGG